MTRSQQRLLSQLATSDNELASGLGQCLEALRLISALPRASPVFVKYTSSPSPTTKAFGREHLSRVPLRTVITLIKTSLSLSDPIYVTTALFFREDGTIDPTPVLVDEDSWKELAPYVHTLHVEDDLERPSTALSSHSTALSANGTVAGVTPVTMCANGHGASTMGGTSVSSSGKGQGLNLNALTFVPSSNAVSIKTGEGAKIHLQGLRKPSSSFSPSCHCVASQPTSPFAILDVSDSG
ncbi:hypothetical protein L210DRAFT_3626857 [Boletus edulis BED1]|uniref:Uncharacterized protein n=1 Tax=Boletus edulis BED1 TaxID=1328754 RepID=A0AAD4GMN7_BOLED|nr:hypothetical protein L210DRAFT_3626857 [Boletus edulis BED1]